MYLVACVVLILYVLLFALSRRETVDSDIHVLQRPFYRGALYLYKWAYIHRVPFLANRQVEKDLGKLYPGENCQQKCTQYYVAKLVRTLIICLVGTFLGVAINVQAQGKRMMDDTGTITRGTYDEENEELEVECSFPDGVQEFTIRVSAEVYDEEEIHWLYEEFRTYLQDIVLGENDSMQALCFNLNLKEVYEGYPFTVAWESENPDIVRSDGTINAVPEEAQETALHAVVSYGEWEWKESFLVRVLPQNLLPEERLHQEMEYALAESEQNSRTESTWKLPDSWQGQPISWKQKIESDGPIIWVGAMGVAVLVYVLADKDLHDEVEKRRQKMKREYPDVVHKLALYLGAGMTIRRAFQRMADEYERMGKEESDRYPVYEEILHVCRELKAGTSEAVAYEHFGKQTGLQEYIRLSTLLSQNLKKGSSTLLPRLREEAGKASAERIQYSRRLGEEAMTKLLLPMVMMLLVIMLMIMIPAFSSMGT